MDRLINEKETLSKKYEKVYALVEKYNSISNKEASVKNSITTGLLSYIQDTSNVLNIKITAIKPIPGDTDKIDVIYQKISYKSVLDFIDKIGSVSNIKIISFSLAKRYDDPVYMNLDLQLEHVTGIDPNGAL